MAMLPMAMFGLEVAPGDVAVPARASIPSAFRITMAAIDPSAESKGPSDAPLRATLKVFRQPLLDEFEDDYDDEDDEDDESFDANQMDRMLAGEDSESSDDDDEDVNGGPSDPAKSKKAKKELARKEIKKMLEAEGMDVDEDEDEEMPNGVNGATKSQKALGKMPASDEEDDSEDDDDLDSGEIEEFVICTLDPAQHYQQPLDLTIGDDERVWFKVSGTHAVYLTGNYVEPSQGGPGGMFDPDSDEDEDYDMEPGDDELDESMDEDESVDDLDDMEDPRVTELTDEEEAPQLTKVEKKKIEPKAGANKNKRRAEDEADGETLDEMITKEKAVSDGASGEPKLSKKQQKKLKKNDGQAGAAPVVEKTQVEAEVPTSNGKKVQFAEKLEQGPTPTKDGKTEKKDDKSKASLGVKTVQGVTIDDKKLGSGQAAKNGDRISMRYIGKLKENQKVFDSNKKGKPFSFKLGAGEVIKGWEIGVQGIQAGGERRITIPAHLAYGSKKLPDIPANSALVFDIKALEVGKSGGK